MKLFQIKIGNAYVKFVSVVFNEVSLTPDIKKIKHVSETEKDYTLIMFPYAEVKEFDVLENKGFATIN